MDGLFHGKPYFLMDDLGGNTHYFWKHPYIYIYIGIEGVTKRPPYRDLLRHQGGAVYPDTSPGSSGNATLGTLDWRRKK